MEISIDFIRTGRFQRHFPDTSMVFRVFVASYFVIVDAIAVATQLSHPYLSIYFMASFVFSSSHSPDYSLLFIAHRLIRIFVYLSKVFYIYFPFSSIECKLFT